MDIALDARCSGSDVVEGYGQSFFFREHVLQYNERGAGTSWRHRFVRDGSGTGLTGERIAE